MMQKTSVRIETAGSAGAAVGSATTTAPVIGKLYAVHIQYDTGTPATADVNINCTHEPNVTLLTIANNATSACYHVRAQACSTAGAAVTSYDTFPVVDQLTATMLQSDPGKGATVTFYFES